MLEGDLVNSIKKGLESSEAWYVHKIDNTARGQTKPCDLWVSWNGHAGGIEAKLHKGASDWDALRKRKIVVLEAKDFRGTQLPSLNRMRARHVAPLIMIGVHDERGKRTRVFALRVETFDLYNQSMTLGDLEESTGVIELERTVNSGWKVPDDKCQYLFGVAHPVGPRPLFKNENPPPPPWEGEIELVAREP